MADDDGFLVIQADKHPHHSAADVLEPHTHGLIAVVNPGELRGR